MRRSRILEDLVFGDGVRERRVRLGLSQQELADRAGLSVRGLRKIESNRVHSPRPGTVRLLADALGLRGDDRERFYSAAVAPVHDAAAPTQPTAGFAPDSTTDDDATHDATADDDVPANRTKLGRVVPAQLPADIGGFTGRTEALRQLTALVGDHDPAHHDPANHDPANHGPRASTAVVITAIAGTAGIGKTALAVHWAHQVRHRYPDGQLYVNLRGFDRTGVVMEPSEAIRRFLDALNVPADRIPSGTDAQAALYRGMLANRRMLILLDNARDAAQVRPLLPGTAGCLVVITSRSQLASLVATENARPVPLDLLTWDEARALLAWRLGDERVAADRDAVDAIIAACARLPLALAIAAARAQCTGFPLACLASELAEARGRLDVLNTGDPATEIRAVFSWSLAALTPAAARAFRLLGLHPGPDLAVAVAASLAGVGRVEARRLLAELVRANLLAQPGPDRYALHDLLRAFAADLTTTTDPAEVRHAASVRMLDHYTHTAVAADRLLYPTRDLVPVALGQPCPAEGPERLTDHRHAMGWLAVERASLLAAQRHAADTALYSHAWQLAWGLDTFLVLEGRWHEEEQVWRVALEAAGRMGDASAGAVAHRILACALTGLGRYDDADAQLRHALDQHASTGDLAGQAHAHYNLAVLRDRQGRPEHALEHALLALGLYRRTDHLRGQASALNAAGWIHTVLGDHARAATRCEQAIALYRRLGDREGEAAAWDSLGCSSSAAGRHSAAVDCFGHALVLFRELGGRFTEAVALTNLGDAHLAAAEHEAARDAWRQALALLTDLDHPDAETVRTKIRSLPAVRVGTAAEPSALAR